MYVRYNARVSIYACSREEYPPFTFDDASPIRATTPASGST